MSQITQGHSDQRQGLAVPCSFRTARLESVAAPWYNAAMQPIVINEKLVWDYDIPEDAQENEAFLEWYVARVLSRGRDEDLRALGFQTIHDFLPRLVLPREIREFWEWYFGQPKVKARYGHPDSVSTAHP